MSMGSDALQRKYPGPLKSFAKELFNEKKICESVHIPFSKIEPLKVGQKGNHLSVTRRVFRQYIKDRLGIKTVDVKQNGQDSIMRQLVDFRHDEQGEIVIVTKKKELEDFLASYAFR